MPVALVVSRRDESSGIWAYSYGLLSLLAEETDFHVLPLLAFCRFIHCYSPGGRTS